MRRRFELNRSNGIAVTALILMLFTLPLSADVNQEADAEIIRELNKEMLWALLVEKDPGPLDRLALEKFIVIAPGGRVENKQQAIAGVSSLDVSNIALSDEQVVFYGDTAVLVGKLEADGTMQPLGKLPTMKYMAVFVKVDGDWRMLSRALVPCAPVAIKHGVC